MAQPAPPSKLRSFNLKPVLISVSFRIVLGQRDGRTEKRFDETDGSGRGGYGWCRQTAVKRDQ